MADAAEKFNAPLQTGSFADGLEKLKRLPREMQEVIANAACHLNINQIFDYYQRFGADDTYKAIRDEIMTAMRPRQGIDNRLTFECGHMHRTFQEAQLCPTYHGMLRGERIKTYHHN